MTIPRKITATVSFVFALAILAAVFAQDEREKSGGAYEFHSIYETGLKLYSRGEYEMALDFFLRAAPFDASGYIAYENIGDTYVALDRKKEAIQAYEFCVSVLGVSPEAGAVSVKKRILEKVISLVRADAGLLSQLKNRLTVDYLEKAVAQENQKRTELQARMKKADEATRRKLVHQQLVAEGKLDDETLKQTETSDRFVVSGALSLLAKGDAYLRRSRFEEARAIYTQLVEMFPEHIEFWERKGDALRMLDRKEEACEAYATAVALAKSIRTKLEAKIHLLK
jgi:tetratricopeptide (TPR) repeat protein